MTDRIYLDHAATTSMTDAARAAVAEGMARWANPSSPHAEGRAARRALEDARAAIASAYGWRREILLTSGASESIAIAMQRSMAPAKIVSAVEHDAVMRHTGPGVAMMPVAADGRIDPVALAGLLSPDRPTLVAVQWANSETGVRQPIAEIAQVVHDAGGLVFVDAAQMPAGADPEVAAHADFVALSAHKRGGPPGIGALLVRDFATLLPTGGQERGYRPGTENLPAALGYAAALAEPEPFARWRVLRDSLDGAICAAGGEVVLADSPRHPAIASYRMPGIASAAQLIQFDSAGFAVSAGSACASGTLKPSHVLTAIGLDDPARGEVVRVSFGRATTAGEVDGFASAWSSVARRGRIRAA
ncbi:aminotransferase class V-fold PLP-dependent enzyme [Sphingomonas sp.]|uniref:cysteine desulfurase family protein n=1 Tax=Sphingomonas sp. TaxID=28214 RepID=UPI001EB64102|nr:aminotransferase class V-fold PLP-dependent enzyme [Sphingomonas sp.]MBX3593975.1 aminotransferase class V-fold PLP-dependent enzyme [Sphingomonas sp.]